jgi:hypothetical protein
VNCELPICSCLSYVSPVPFFHLAVEEGALEGKLLGMAIRVRVPDTRQVPDGYGYGGDFLPTGGTRTRSELRRVFFFTRG